MLLLLMLGIFQFLPVGSDGRAQDIMSLPQDWSGSEYNQKIASVGNLDISAREFLLSYEFGPAFLKRTEQSKEKYLMVMIYEKLLALEGYRQKLDQSESVRLTCKAYTEDLMTEELFKEKIMKRIEVSDDEINQVLPLEKRHLSLRWLYCKDKTSIDEQEQQLNDGVSFDSLFAAQLSAGIDETDRSLSSTLYQLVIRNPSLAAIVKTLPPGTPSKPIEVSDGWYIVNLDDIWTNPITTQSEEIALSHELERSIFKRKVDQASDRYVKDLMDAENPQIDKETFAEMVFYLNAIASDTAKYDAHLINAKLGRLDRESIQTVRLEVCAKHLLVRGNTCRISFDDFVDWYRPRATFIKFSSRSVDKFILEVQDTIWRLVRDFLLVKQAKLLGLDKREAVIKQVKWWEDKFVFNAVKLETAAAIKFNEQDLQTYYRENIKHYCDPAGQIISFEKARDNVRNDFLQEKYMNNLMHRVLALKKDYDIYINKEMLEHLTVQEEENPRAIDLYAVKKGGLLPRQPYPTIDWEWQLWY